MTLEEAIEQCDKISHKFGNMKEGTDHAQLKEWLEELQDRRKPATVTPFHIECETVKLTSGNQWLRFYGGCEIDLCDISGKWFFKVTYHGIHIEDKPDTDRTNIYYADIDSVTNIDCQDVKEKDNE